MELPGLSVVIPNFNHAQYLPRCLEAILAQSVQPQKFLVIDDASTDDSIQVIESYAHRFPHLRLVRNERNQGVTPTINRELQVAMDDFVCFGADGLLPSLDGGLIPLDG